jgi:hypothetical protein
MRWIQMHDASATPGNQIYQQREGIPTVVFKVKHMITKH